MTFSVTIWCLRCGGFDGRWCEHILLLNLCTFVAVGVAVAFIPFAVDEGQSNRPRCNSTVECLMECGGVVGVGVRNSLRGVTRESARW